MRRAAAGREEGAGAGPLPAGGGRGGGGCTSGPARRALPARVAPQLTVAQRRRVNPPVSVGQGLPGEQQLVAAPAAQRRRGQGSQPAGRALLGPHSRSGAAGGEGVAALGPGAGGGGSRRGGGGCGAAHPPPRPPPACGGAASWHGADTGGSRCLHRRGPAMARPQEAPQEPPFRLRIHPRCGNTPLFPSSSGGSRPQLPAARLPLRAQRPPPPSPGKDRAPLGLGSGGGLLASPFPLQGVCVWGWGAEAGGAASPPEFVIGAAAALSPHGRPGPASLPRAARPPGACAVPPAPRGPREIRDGRAGAAPAAGGRSAAGPEHRARPGGQPPTPAVTPERGRAARAREAGIRTELLLRPVGSAHHRIRWVGKYLRHRRAQPMTEPSPCQLHHGINAQSFPTHL